MNNNLDESKLSYVLIVRYGEVALKGTNKPYFERILIQRIRTALSSYFHSNDISIGKDGGLILIRGDISKIKDELVTGCLRVFGVASVSYALSMKRKAKEDDKLENIGKYLQFFLQERITEKSKSTAKLTFKIETKRADKSFPSTSPQLSRDLGELALNSLSSELEVNVHNPNILLTVHIKPKEIFFFDEKETGFGGLPVGTNGKGLILLSGGIDSPVAAFMMAKRGMRIEAVHFMSYPFTSTLALDKVKKLAEIISEYTGEIKMHIVNILGVQEKIRKQAPEEYGTIITRWFMMRLGEKIAKLTRSNMLITGESLGQVASQTAEGIMVSDAAVGLPVLRPLIGMDKIDIMDIAKKIGTYETSILPYEDCCTVFLPKHPKTRPNLGETVEIIRKMEDMDALLDELVENMESVSIAFCPRGLANSEAF
jgi:thiamine biosynthesis protein ThiI